MKKIILSFVLVLSTVAAVAQKITILHTNDIHSTVMPLSEQLSDTLKAGRGGMMRCMAMVEDERKADPELLLFDSGDYSQGSAYYSMFKGEVEVGLMNMMGYDAAAIGNHEFDYGLDNLARLVKMADFPIVCANYDFTDTPLDSLVKPYVVIERTGKRIGVFGIGPKLEGLVAQANCQNVKFFDPISTSQRVVDKLLHGEQCDIVVCLSHLGWDMGDSLDFVDLITNVKGIDIVLGGHSHTYMEQMEYVEDPDGRMVPVDQNGKHGIYVGKIVIE